MESCCWSLVPLEKELRALPRVLNSGNITCKLSCRAGGMFLWEFCCIGTVWSGGLIEIPSFFSPVNPNWGGSGGAMPLKQRFELQNQLIVKPCCLLRAGSGAAHPPSVALLLRSDAKSMAIFLFTLMGALYQPLIDEKFLFLKQLHIIRYT